MPRGLATLEPWRARFIPGFQQRFLQRFRQGFQHHSFSKGSSSLINCLPQKIIPKKSQKLSSQKFRQGCNRSQTSNLTTQHIKQSKKQCKKNEINTRIGAQQNVPARGSGNRVPAGFQQGFAKVPARFQQSSSRSPARFQQDFSDFPAIPARFHLFPAGSTKCQHCSSKVPSRVLAGLQQGSSKISATFRQFQEGFTCFQQVPQNASTVPARFQQSSSRAPARFQRDFRNSPT